MNKQNILPIPHPDAKQLSDQLFLCIADEIHKNGPMSFARLMQLALYAPTYGYYRNAYQKFGHDGDFVTAPEISSLFSYCLANQCAQILSEIKGGDILEFGAGRGVMAADILCALNIKNQLPNHYYILETSAFLKSQQMKTIQTKIPDFFNHVIWLETLPTKPIQGVILANEVLDAMPVNQFTWQNGFKECGVSINNNQLVPCLLEKENAALTTQLNQYHIPFENGYTSEINLLLPGWIRSIASILSRGAVLIIDYGFPRSEYYHPDRSTGTVMCHYRHYAHGNYFLHPGLQDITAHVDFTAVAEAANENDLDVVGFSNQAAFLINCGLLDFAHHARDEKTRFLQNQQIMQLTSPSEMGELCKVMALSKNIDCELMGFQTLNQLARL